MADVAARMQRPRRVESQENYVGRRIKRKFYLDDARGQPTSRQAEFEGTVVRRLGDGRWEIDYDDGDTTQAPLDTATLRGFLIHERPPPRVLAAPAVPPDARAPRGKRPRTADTSPCQAPVLDITGACVDVLPPLDGNERRVLGQTLSAFTAGKREQFRAAFRADPSRPWAEVLTENVVDDRQVLDNLRSYHWPGEDCPPGTERSMRLPEDPPLHPALESFIVPQSDSRVGLRGQFSVRVRRDWPAAIPASTPLGPYRALTLTKTEMDFAYALARGGPHQAFKFNCDVRVPLPPLVEAIPDSRPEKMVVVEHLLEVFATEYTNWNARSISLKEAQEAAAAARAAAGAVTEVTEDDEESEDEEEIPPQLSASAYGFGNMLCLVNDHYGPDKRPQETHEQPAGGRGRGRGRWRGRGRGRAQEADADEPNATFLEVLVHGWPFLFMSTVAPIWPGQEVAVDYGTVRPLSTQFRPRLRSNVCVPQYYWNLVGGLEHRAHLAMAALAEGEVGEVGAAQQQERSNVVQSEGGSVIVPASGAFRR